MMSGNFKSFSKGKKILEHAGFSVTILSKISVGSSVNVAANLHSIFVRNCSQLIILGHVRTDD